ncbi:MAG: trypsin-like peptidase domain-containing protein [Planctomycetota bacterium]
MAEHENEKADLDRVSEQSDSSWELLPSSALPNSTKHGANNHLDANSQDSASSEDSLADAEESPTHRDADETSGPMSLSSRPKGRRELHPAQLATSTFLSLVMVLGLLLLTRLLVPSLVESIRYSWHRGQLRAEYELSHEQLRSVSLDSLAEVSKLVSQRMGPSVVHINVRRSLGMTLDGDSQVRVPKLFDAFEGQGSGFIISSDGYILTNDHVLEGGREVTVTMSDGRKLPAKVIGRDWQTDLAVIQVDADGLLPIEWGESKDVQIGTPVWAVGSPFGLQQTVTFGIISGKHRVDFGGTRASSGRRNPTPYGDLMQSDVALNPGNSGGPLVNSLGQVVGVNAAILGETFQGVSFSIPSRVATRVSEFLIESGSVPRGWLGVVLEELADEDKYLADGKKKSGVRVGRFPPGIESPAREAGLKTGDIIVAFNGDAVFDSPQLIREIGETPAGREVVLAIRRPKTGVRKSSDDTEGKEDGVNETTDREQDQFKKMEITVTLGERDPMLGQRPPSRRSEYGGPSER